jgi:hypothetical protein
LTVAPSLPLEDGRVYERAAALTSELANRHGLRPEGAAPFDGEKGAECYHENRFFLCVTAMAGEVQFYFAETVFEFSAQGREIWQQLQEAAQAEFGTAAVRECRWNYRPDPERLQDEHSGARAVCVPTGTSIRENPIGTQ